MGPAVATVMLCKGVNLKFPELGYKPKLRTVCQRRRAFGNLDHITLSCMCSIKLTTRTSGIACGLHQAYFSGAFLRLVPRLLLLWRVQESVDGLMLQGL